jgi:outer membrane protein assembly factor BamE
MAPQFSVRSYLAFASTSVCLSVAAVALSGCGAFNKKDGYAGLFTPYKVEVVQGNVVTQEQVAQVTVGMTRAQVRDILGSPLLADVFHASRWDYVFTIRRQGTEAQRRSIVALFDGDVLKSIDTGGDLPAEEAFVASIDSNKPAGKTAPLEMSAAQLQAMKAPPKPAAVDLPVATPGRVYPPLEPR